MSSDDNRKTIYQVIAGVLIFVLFASIIPLMIAGAYDVPSNDDYSFSADAHVAYVNTGSVLQAICEACRQAVTSYWTWQGTYSAIFLMALQPAVFGLHCYRATPIIMLFGLIIGIFSLMLSLFDHVFRLEKTAGLSAAAVASMLCIQMMPSPAEGLYWYNGAIYYTFFHGIAMLSFALLVLFVARGGKGKLAGLIVLELFLAGGNYTTALCSAIIWASTILLLILRKNRKWKILLVPFCFFLAGFAVNICAPGNAVRQEQMIHIPNVFGDILASFRDGIRFGVKWFQYPLLGAAVFLFFLFWSYLGECEFSFSMPAIVTIYSFCLFSALFCPPEYAMGSSGPLRLKDIQYYSYIILVLLNVFYWTGWIHKKSKRSFSRKSGNVFIIASGCLCMLLCLIYLKTGAYTSFEAVGLLRSGEAKIYYQAAESRLAVLEDPNIVDAEIQPYPCTPFLIYHGDVTADPKHYVNESVAAFYGKTSVVLKTGE